jgi:hypothetical protein
MGVSDQHHAPAALTPGERRTTDNTFVIKSTIDKYLRVNRGLIYWCLVDSEKVFDLTERKALWYKIRRRRVSDNMV